MKTVASKIDNSLHEQVISRCNERGCSPSEYIRELVKSDLAGNGKPKQPRIFVARKDPRTDGYVYFDAATGEQVQPVRR